MAVTINSIITYIKKGISVHRRPTVCPLCPPLPAQISRKATPQESPHPFPFHSVNKYVLITYYAPGTLLGKE